MHVDSETSAVLQAPGVLLQCNMQGVVDGSAQVGLLGLPQLPADVLTELALTLMHCQGGQQPYRYRGKLMLSVMSALPLCNGSSRARTHCCVHDDQSRKNYSGHTSPGQTVEKDLPMTVLCLSKTIFSIIYTSTD